MTKTDINRAIDYLVKERDYLQYEAEQDDTTAEDVYHLTVVINALKAKTGYKPRSMYKHA